MRYNGVDYSFDDDFASPADFDEGFEKSDAMRAAEREHFSNRSGNANNYQVTEPKGFDFSKQPDEEMVQKLLAEKQASSKQTDASDGFFPVTEPTPFDDDYDSKIERPEPKFPTLETPGNLDGGRTAAAAEQQLGRPAGFYKGDDALAEQEAAEDRADERYFESIKAVMNKADNIPNASVEASDKTLGG